MYKTGQQTGRGFHDIPIIITTFNNKPLPHLLVQGQPKAYTIAPQPISKVQMRQGTGVDQTRLLGVHSLLAVATCLISMHT